MKKPSEDFNPLVPLIVRRFPSTKIFTSSGLAPGPSRARPGDAVLLSGPIGRHGIAIMAAREGIAFDAEIESDSAALPPLVERLRTAAGSEVHVLRDPTHGGVASALNEIAAASRVGIALAEARIPIPSPVAAAREMLGFDPLYVANEGVLVAFVAEQAAEAALTALRGHPLGREAARIGRAVDAHPGLVILETAVGGTRGRGHAPRRPAAAHLLAHATTPRHR